MSSSFNFIIKNGKCFINGQLKKADIGISNGNIKKIGNIETSKETIKEDKYDFSVFKNKYFTGSKREAVSKRLFTYFNLEKCKDKLVIIIAHQVVAGVFDKTIDVQ